MIFTRNSNDYWWADVNSSEEPHVGQLFMTEITDDGVYGIIFEPETYEDGKFYDSGKKGFQIWHYSKSAIKTIATAKNVSVTPEEMEERMLQGAGNSKYEQIRYIEVTSAAKEDVYKLLNKIYKIGLAEIYRTGRLEFTEEDKKFYQASQEKEPGLADMLTQEQKDEIRKSEELARMLDMPLETAEFGYGMQKEARERHQDHYGSLKSFGKSK